MSHQDLLDLLRRSPFLPFRIYATDGRTYDVRHPDQALVLRTRVILPLASNPDEVADRSEHLDPGPYHPCRGADARFGFEGGIGRMIDRTPGPRSRPDGFVHQPMEAIAELEVARGQDLGQHDADQLVLRVNPEVGVIDPAPTEAADRIFLPSASSRVVTPKP